MAELDRVGAPVAPTVDSCARRLILAAQKLTEPAFSLFDRLYLKGEQPAQVMTALHMTRDEFEERQSNMLRALMAATT